MSGVRNITVPWVPLDEFDWSFARTGPLPWNLTVWCLLAVFTSLPIWMTVELTAWVLYAFERWSGIYFWSVLATTWGLTIRAIGFLLKFCVPEANWILTYVLSEVGWVMMVTGFSIVLWSRLHLVISPGTPILRIVLAMIIIDGFLFHVPTVIFQYFMSNAATHEKYLPYMNVMERVQVLAFSVQEAIISSIYIWGTMQMFKLSLNAKAKNTLAFLIIVQVAVVLADIPVIVLDYCNYFTLKAVIHSFIYAFKLQIEFVVLNEFKHLANGGITGAFALLLQDAASLQLNVTAVGARDGSSTLECWQMNVPFKTSVDPGTAGGFVTTLRNVSNVTYSILPSQWVYFTTGLAYITLPDDRDTSAFINGGQFSLVFAADTAAVSRKGHRTQYPGITESIALQIPTSDGKVPEHNVLHMGPCNFNEVAGVREFLPAQKNWDYVSQKVEGWANMLSPFIPS
ncbi:hypothetical protein GL218_04546 [Daldinia childiae]|uniref:uncharacterized protein n=1 Tax=Daldinia childiae TaxID=326645 RepID=UPI0014481439|nr:uncharacterized protein GL218_04546 [Daldinia childiae]KAF3059424.1 hypothetical protein GL218_04546 [Daldinia childiae]